MLYLQKMCERKYVNKTKFKDDLQFARYDAHCQKFNIKVKEVDLDIIAEDFLLKKEQRWLSESIKDFGDYRYEFYRNYRII